MTVSKYYSIYSMPYYNNKTCQYEKIITISKIPEDDMKTYVVKIKPNTLSAFQKNTNCSTQCVYVFKSSIVSESSCNSDYLQVDDLPNLLIYLREKSYSIDTETANMLNNSPITTTYNNNQTLITFISKIAPITTTVV